MGEWQTVKAENLVRHKNGNYYLRAKVAGKIIRRSLRTDTLRIAKIKRDSLVAQLRLKAGSVRNASKMTLAEAIAVTEGHYARIPSYRIKPRSLQYRQQLLKVMRETLPNRPVNTWARAEIATWWESPRLGDYSAQRRNNILGTFRQMMKLAIKSGARSSDPSEGIERVRIPVRHLTLPSRTDFARIVADIRRQGKRASTESANFVEFLAYSGLRISEARAVEWEHIGDNAITVTGGESGTKNHTVRRVPIIPPMRELLDRMREGNPCRGPLWSIKTPRIALDNACARLGVAHIRIHDLRHLFATACIEAGVDIPTLSRWLGHKDGGLLALKTYGHLRDEHSQAQAAKVVF